MTETTEGLRETLFRAIRAAGREVDGNALNAVVAALSRLFDPGDLPARMAAAIIKAWPDLASDPVYVEQLAEVALSVRWEDAVRDRARAEYAEGQLSSRRDHERRWAGRERAEAELERLRAELNRTQDAYGGLSSELVRTEAERDEAREQLRLANIDAVTTAADLDRTEAEVERLRAELAAADVELNEALNHNDDNCSVVAERDALVDEVKTLQKDLEELRGAQKEWLRFRRERDALKAANADVLNAAADMLDALPPGGALLSGPYWYRQGVRDAASLLRDWANHPGALDAPETPGDAETEDRS
jgi:hypothetical protein